ncbi:S8 family peptidase, partial [Macrococcus caseolyticus]
TLAVLSQTAVQNLLDSQGSHPLVDGQDSKGFDLTHIYDKSSFNGYAGKFLPEVVEILAKHPGVAFIEQDSKVHALKPKEEDQAPWGLTRVSQRDHLGLGTYNKYLYDAEAGKGVTSYIVDTGIYIDHEDFEGRAVWGKTMPAGDSDVDAHGHGSHCAGTIGGNKYGVAKKAKLVAVKVLGSDGSGSMSDVIGGVEFVVESHRAEQKEKGSKHKGSTANMSLGGGKSPALDLAVNAATEAGVHFAVAAGNENQDACNTSPAGAEGAVTVGATSVNDDRAYFSNYGKCVDIFAPGVNVLSVGTYSPSATAIMSGTSMASPHIAGLLTYFISLQPSTDSQYSTRGTISTRELKKYLIDFGTPDAINDLDSDSPNVIAFNGGGKDISGFWQNSDEKSKIDNDEDDNKHEKEPSFFDKIEDLFEEVVEGIEESLESFF